MDNLNSINVKNLNCKLNIKKNYYNAQSYNIVFDIQKSLITNTRKTMSRFFINSNLTLT